MRFRGWVDRQLGRMRTQNGGLMGPFRDAA